MFLMFIKTYHSKDIADVNAAPDWSKKQLKSIALRTSICILFVSLAMFALFDFSTNQFQFVLESQEINYIYIIPSPSNDYSLESSLLNQLVRSFNLDSSVLNQEVSPFNFYLGVDGLSIYFVLLTTIIMPVSLLSNWTSISHNLKTYVIPILLLETLLLSVFLVLDILFFYIFFESILPPLFILIGSFGSSDRVRASLYLFLYTLLGSLFLLLSIVTMSSRTGITDFDALFKINFNYFIQLFLFCGIFIAFAVKTPIIFLNSWLLKAHVQSPLSGSIILAGIVLKLSFYGILRLILPLLPKAYINCTFFIYLIGVITIVYASVSTLRTIDVKELIAYSSVSHAAVYLMGVFSKTIQGIEGGIALALAHGFVSSGLFICAGGALYDRSFTRLITYYRGIAQMMPIFSVILFILCLGNCGVPLTLNFVGEFLSLYGAFERSPILGALASSSIIFSAAYTIYMFNRIAFAGSYSKFFIVNIPDLNKREFYVLLSLVLFTVALGIYPAPVLDGLHYSVTTLIYSVPNLYIVTTLFKSKSSWQWKLNSPPKPHAFVNCEASPVQSGLFSFTFSIKSLLSKCKSNFYVLLWASFIAWAYKYPTRILLDQLDLLAYYPIFNVMFALLSVVVIANLNGKKVTKAMIIIGAILGLSIPYTVPYVHYYISQPLTAHFIEGFECLLLLLSLEKLVDIQYGDGYSEDKLFSIRKYFTSNHQTTHSTRHSPGGTGINVGDSGSGDNAGASSSHDTSTKIGKVSQTARSSGNNSITPDEIKQGAFEYLEQDDSTNPRILSESVRRNSSFDLLPKGAISDTVKSEILQEAKKRSPDIINIPDFISKKPLTLDYWRHKNLNAQATLELKIIEVIKEKVQLSKVENAILNAKMHENIKSLQGIKNVSFNRMQESFHHLNHKDRKAIKKHMPGFVTKETHSDSEDSS